MFGNVKVDEVADVVVFKDTYFPMGFDTENAGYTVSIKAETINVAMVLKLTRSSHEFS